MKRYGIQIMFALALAFVPTAAFARTEFFLEGPTDVRPGTEFPLTLKARIDESINALRVTVRFDPTRLTILTADDRDSVVRYWLERPMPSTSGTIRMEGMIPGGVGPGFTDTVVIARMMVKTPRNGPVTVNINDALVYLNQPDPREDVVTTRPFTIQVRTDAPVFSVQPLADAPRDIYARIVREPLIHDGAWSLVFDVRTEHGTAAVRVRERFFGLGGVWRDAENPYQLSDQWLLSILEVGVASGSSQEVVKTIVPGRLQSIFALLAVILIVLALRWRRSRKG